MKFTVNRESLLKPLLTVQGVVERRQTLAILSNLLLSLQDELLSITATDMEVELVAHATIPDGINGEITIPARKFIDICRSLPTDSQVEFDLDGEKAVFRSGRSRFSLATLPATDYPSSDSLTDALTLNIEQKELKRLLELTQFAMAHQDVRYYLNGLLLEIGSEGLSTIATDGHRLAMADLATRTDGVDEQRQVIIPRKAVGELTRLLNSEEGMVSVEVSSNLVRFTLPEMQLTSKLIDGRFPDYERVIPEVTDDGRHIKVDRELLRQSLARASILSNEKYRAIRLNLEDGVLRILANNPDQEEAEDELEVDYVGGPLEIGFNVSYLIEALGALPAEIAHVYLTDASSSCLIRGVGREDCQYVVMPMRL